MPQLLPGFSALVYSGAVLAMLLLAFHPLAPVATAFGLFVAIPAVWAFNYLTTRVEGFTVEMDNSASELIDYMAKKTAT